MMQFTEVMDKVQYYLENPTEGMCPAHQSHCDHVIDVVTSRGPVEADPEYQVIVDSNNLVADNEISKTHMMEDQYSRPFQRTYTWQLCNNTQW